MTRQEAEGKLKQIFGIEKFYDEQWETINRIFNGERILLIERTGFGKSLCYQFPATQFDGITVIFSPLIALMRDQVNNLRAKGISAAYINSEQSPEENSKVLEDALNSRIKILYIAPERQENNTWIEPTRHLNLSMIVIDEAHTISTWGHDFRPAFRRIINLVQLLPQHLPILATTATATKKVQKDIEQQIGGRLTTIRGNLIRPNFELQVIKVQSEDEKMAWIVENINYLNGNGLIYTGTRVNTEIYAKWLQFNNINAIDYNAGLDSENRVNIENGLINNTWKCIVCTNALGMGFDKPDIRFIIHTQIPQSPIHYYQEIGRAGRDGKPARIILFFNEQKSPNNDIETDLILPKSFIENARPSVKRYEKVISLLKEEQLSEREITKKANINTTQARVIKADLIAQGIIKEVVYNRTKKYEYQYNAPTLNTALFDQLRKNKLEELEAMKQYIYTSEPRMKYLCTFLDSDIIDNYSNCDNTNLPKITSTLSKEMKIKLENYRETYYPILEVSSWTTRKSNSRVCFKSPNNILVEKITKDDLGKSSTTKIFEFTQDIDYSSFNSEERDIINDHINRASRLVDGYATSYYGVSNIGETIHRCKYENGGDFPDFLLKRTLSMFVKKFKGIHFDMVLYIPPTKSGTLVKNFSEKFAKTLNIPINHNLTKTRITSEQKIFQNSYSKQDNVSGAFDINTNINGKNIVLIDDIFDSGATIKEAGKLLTSKGAKLIVPIVIAKTVGVTL